MPFKSKRKKTLKINLPKIKCVLLFPDELNDYKLKSQKNKTNENDIKLAENIESKLSLEFLN